MKNIVRLIIFITTLIPLAAVASSITPNENNTIAQSAQEYRQWSHHAKLLEQTKCDIMEHQMILDMARKETRAIIALEKTSYAPIGNRCLKKTKING